MSIKNKKLLFPLLAIVILAIVLLSPNIAFGQGGVNMNSSAWDSSGWASSGGDSSSWNPVTWALGQLFTRLAVGIPIFIFLIALAVIGSVCMLFTSFASQLLGWVTTGNLAAHLSFTHEAIVTIGLDITQSLANIILIFSLLVIGFATILGIQKYNAKKLLPLLIIIALLVNFAPTICGAIVDFFNIFTHYFIANPDRPLGSGWATMKTTFGGMWSTVWDSITNVIFASEWHWQEILQNAGAVIGRGIALLGFTIFGGMLLFMFFLIFLLRYIMIWALVILSPVAFACYILPATKGAFDWWWEQFIQWCSIGVIGGFFLYLSDYLLLKAPQMIDVNPNNFGFFAPFAQGALPYMVPLAFMFLALLFTQKTNAVFAQKSIQISKSVGKGVKSVAKGTGKSMLKEAWKKPFGRKGTEEGKRGLRERTKAAAERIGAGLKKTPFLRETKAGEKVSKFGRFQENINKAQEEVASESSPTIGEDIASGKLKGLEATGGIIELIKRGDIDDLLKAYSQKYYGNKEHTEDVLKDNRFNQEIGGWLTMANRAGKVNGIIRGDPRLAGAGRGYAGLSSNYEAAVEKATQDAKVSNVSSWDSTVPSSPEVIENAMKYKAKPFWQAMDTQVTRGQTHALDAIDKLYDEWKRGGGNNREFILQHPHYFRALEDRQFRSRGWRLPAGMDESTFDQMSKNGEIGRAVGTAGGPGGGGGTPGISGGSAGGSTPAPEGTSGAGSRTPEGERGPSSGSPEGTRGI